MIIETQGLAKSFKGRKGVVEAVKGVDLRVEPGQIFGFLGPNGAGKTTTLRMLTTLVKPSGGTAKVAGYDLKNEPLKVRQRIGYVSQNGGVDEAATGRENLILQARMYRLDKATARRRSQELIGKLELESFADRPAKTYSGGQRRRLDLALGMVHQPTLLFLDEPTTGLDPQSRARLWDEVRKLREDGTTIFVTTHYLEEADALCDYLAIMDDGRVVAEGTPATLKRQISGDVVTLGLPVAQIEPARDMLKQLPFVRETEVHQENVRLMVEEGEKSLPGILQKLGEMGLVASTIELARPSLDDVFLRQTGRSLREATN